MASSVHADDGDESPSRRHDFDSGWLVTGGLYGGYLRRPPGITSFSTPSGFRFSALEGRDISPDHGVGLIGLDLRLGFSTRTPIFFNLFGVRVAYPIGSPYHVDVTDDDGKAGRIRLHNSLYGEILFPGIGLRFATANVRFGLAITPALAVYATTGTVTQGALTADVDANGVGLNLDGDAFFCGRIARTDPEATWICGYAAPLLYTSTPETFFNGIIVGIRIDASAKSIPWFGR